MFRVYELNGFNAKVSKFPEHFSLWWWNSSFTILTWEKCSSQFTMMRLLTWSGADYIHSHCYRGNVLWYRKSADSLERNCWTTVKLFPDDPDSSRD